MKGDLFDIPAVLKREKNKKPVIMVEPEVAPVVSNDPYDEAPLEYGCVAYVMLKGEPGRDPKTMAKPEPSWPVNGWAIYLIYEWRGTWAHALHVTHLTKFRIRHDHPSLTRARVVADISPAQVAAQILSRIELCKSHHMGLDYRTARGISAFLGSINSFDTSAFPVADVNEFIHGVKENDMAGKKKAADAVTATEPEKKEKKAPRKVVDAESKITLLAENNPKRKGSKAHGVFEKYKTGMTVAQFLAAGGTRADLKYDSAHGFIKIAA